jgi:formylglycine-generating enzyme required for sulfatase activity
LRETSIRSTTGGERDGGRGHNGGVWEWTSTLFDSYEGYVPSKLYPGYVGTQSYNLLADILLNLRYSKDFFDGAHQVVLGGSYATIPRIAERRSLRNWYQQKYPYPWVGARMVYDIAK